MIRVMVLWGLGINCEEETVAAYKLAGADARLVHVNEFLAEEESLKDFQVLHFPGGFSFGDHLGAGRVLANRIRFKKTKAGKSFRDEIVEFTKRDGFVFGVCNGFQILVQLGLFSESDENPKISLIQNNSGNFQDRWVRCRFEEKNILSEIWNHEEMDLPIRHGEGRLFVSDESEKERLVKNNLIAMTYCGENPNGSFLSCAALSDAKGRVLGMMPHPEAFLSFYNHPQWCGKSVDENKVHGLRFFKNLVKYIEG